MSVFEALKQRFAESVSFLSRQLDEKGPSAGLRWAFGPLDRRDDVSLRTWLLGGACIGVMTVAAMGCINAGLASSPIVAGAGILHVATQFDYFEPIRHDAKSFFAVVGISNALLLAVTSVINVKGHYRLIASVRESAEVSRPLVSRTAFKVADMVRHAGTGVYRTTSAFKKFRSWRRSDDHG